MSVLKSPICEAQARLNLLHSVHSYFVRCLPTLDNVENERYSVNAGDKIFYQNDITLLRSDIKALPTILQNINVDQAACDNNTDRLIDIFDSLLALFEESVQIRETSHETVPIPEGMEAFPKLVSLRNLQRRHDISRKDACDNINNPKEENHVNPVEPTRFSFRSFVVGQRDASNLNKKSHVQSAASFFSKLVSLRVRRRRHDSPGDAQPAAPSSTPVPETQFSMSSMDSPSSYINFPPPQKTIAMCQVVVEKFRQDILDMFRDEARQWDTECQLQEITSEEVNFIRDAHEFSKESTSLFQLLINCSVCNDEHTARLHLSGLRTKRLEMLLGTCDNDWIPASFTRSLPATLPEKKFEYSMCTHLANVEPRSQIIRGCFNETTIWEDFTTDFEPYNLSIEHLPLKTLDYHLGEFQRLDRVTQKVVVLHLACSLFKFCGSPWIQHEFDRENIFLLPHLSSNNRLNYWCPHILCQLGLHPGPRSLEEVVAALGVLILEVEVNHSAGWTPKDEDYETDTKSNINRLSRILEDWKGSLPDVYRGIGLACFSFASLVRDFDHPNIGEDLKKFTILYKCIVNPLFQKLASDFVAVATLFQGISGLSIPTRRKKTSTSSPIVLYDDWEPTEPDKKSRYAEELIKELNNNFLCKIKTLRENTKRVSLATAYKHSKSPDRIRIAVLDTGIDITDPIIKYAVKYGNKSRIKDKQSWVGSDDNNWNDEYGHGTHVTRLLLEMAPAAEIYVAKITDGKTVDAENMDRIAEAIDCAVEKWKVHIISMSFGYESDCQAIEDAIERASKADVLMFAAASNEGGNKRDRSRPGRNPAVICIHACDGMGNKGDMNPNPKPNNDNFTALGVAVKSSWKGRDVYKSGTSFATPIAAAFAADILEFANYKCELREEKRRLLYKQRGMQAVFRVMSTNRDQYDYLQPNLLWDSGDEGVAKTIQDVLASQ